MAEIVNLRMARKARDRTNDKAKADANRALHGQTKAERTATKAEITRIERIVDGARLERSPDRKDT